MTIRRTHSEPQHCVLFRVYQRKAGVGNGMRNRLPNNTLPFII
jgi:hypothetical protein